MTRVVALSDYQVNPYANDSRASVGLQSDRVLTIIVTAAMSVCVVIYETCDDLLANSPESRVGPIRGWIRLYLR